MVLRDLRDELAQHLRHLAAGVTTNDQFEDATDDILSRDRTGQDRVLRAIYAQAWFLYGDLHEYKLRRRNALSSQQRHEIARWIMFLHSDLEYEWPFDYADAPGLLANFLTLGAVGRKWCRRVETEMRALGDWDLWPFFRRSDFDRVRRHPRLLAGAP